VSARVLSFEEGRRRRRRRARPAGREAAPQQGTSGSATFTVVPGKGTTVSVTGWSGMTPSGGNAA